MRELDELLLRYLENRYPRAAADEKAAFHELLRLADPEINGYLLQRQIPDAEAVARVVEHILSLPES